MFLGLKRDHYFKILALLMAAFLWLYVANDQNPIISRNYQIPLGLDSERLDSERLDYVISGLPETVSITVKSPKNIGTGLKAGDFIAKVNLLGIEEGTQQLLVQVSAPSGVDVIQVRPQVITLEVDKIGQKEVEINISLQGKVAQGTQTGVPVVSPSWVTVEGAEKLLADLDSISLSVDVTGAGETITKYLVVEPGVEGVTVISGRVLVTVPVTAMPSVNLPVKVNLAGEPATGYIAGQPVMEQVWCKVTGPQEVVDGLTAVYAQDLDITGAAENVDREVELVLPPGAVSVQPERLRVTVQIIPAAVNEQPPAEVRSENTVSEETGDDETVASEITEDTVGDDTENQGENQPQDGASDNLAPEESSEENSGEDGVGEDAEASSE